MKGNSSNGKKDNSKRLTMVKRQIFLDITEKMNTQDSNIPTLKDGATGRETTFSEEEKIILEWLSTTGPDFHSHEVAETFKQYLESASPVCGDNLLAFRGRILDPSLKSCGPLVLGPPPPSYAGLGRYNHRDKPALYLSDSTCGVFRELNPSPGDDNQIVAQEYLLSLETLKIADFLSHGLPDFINILFSNIERGEYRGMGVDQNLHKHGAFIADLVKDQGFDGMRVPGVRGEPGQHYSNIVMFDPEPRWRNWLSPGVLPIPI